MTASVATAALTTRRSTPGNDRLSGGAGNDQLGGDEGDDWLDGGTGNDYLDGDNVVGGGGADSFAFTVAPGASNADTIVDFISAEDRIVLDGTVHASSGPSGTFAAGDARFWSSGTGTAQDGNDRVIYNSSNGQLWYDADGNGAGSRQLIATLLGAPTLGAPNIEVINGGGGGGGSMINGTSANDTLTGTAGNDTINGLGGNDLFVAGSTGGADVIDGGTGTDSIEFRDRATSGVVVDFGAGTITGGSSGTISFTAVERVVASNFADSLTGAAGGQTLTGQGGADTLWGARGVDTLWGAGRQRRVRVPRDGLRERRPGQRLRLRRGQAAARRCGVHFDRGDGQFCGWRRALLGFLQRRGTRPE